ncbi:tryptophan 7-halogenase [Roseateles sp.]|uniref:tryptophan 7-halogenase n=1 Tax=Roseateles sp. TaxID=1971397 RepID=UPI003267B5C0
MPDPRHRHRRRRHRRLDDGALLANLDGKPLADPRPLRFTAGMRRKTWHRNLVAIGLAGGFLEPLESTSMHLVQQTIQQKIALYQAHGRVTRFNSELFAETAWLQVMAGQNLLPESFHPFAALQPEDSVHAYLEAVHRSVAGSVALMPDHADYIARHCKG